VGPPGQTGVVYYLHADHLGSTSLATYSSGAQAGQIVAQQRYYPYGEVRWSEGTFPTDYTFTGQRAEDFGLLDYNARFYDPYLGRFISTDTVVPNAANPQEWNRYGYCVNNPVIYVDPTGHQIRPTEYQPFDISFTGTTGPYVLSADAQVSYSWPPPPPTIGLSDIRNDDGVLLVYGTPSSAQLRQELVIVHGEGSLGLAAASAEFRNVRTTPLLGGGTAREHDEWAVSVGPAAQVPVLGGVSLRAGYSPGSGKLTPSVKGKLLGGDLSLQPGGVKLGYVPDVGPGARIGVDWDIGEAQFLLTSHGYLSETGLDKFGEYYAPDATLREMYIEHGFWSRKQGWISGLDMLRCRVGSGWWDLPYEEVPQ